MPGSYDILRLPSTSWFDFWKHCCRSSAVIVFTVAPNSWMKQTLVKLRIGHFTWGLMEMYWWNWPCTREGIPELKIAEALVPFNMFQSQSSVPEQPLSLRFSFCSFLSWRRPGHRQSVSSSLIQFGKFENSICCRLPGWDEIVTEPAFTRWQLGVLLPVIGCYWWSHNFAGAIRRPFLSFMKPGLWHPNLCAFFRTTPLVLPDLEASMDALRSSKSTSGKLSRTACAPWDLVMGNHFYVQRCYSITISVFSIRPHTIPTYLRLQHLSGLYISFHYFPCHSSVLDLGSLVIHLQFCWKLVSCYNPGETPPLPAGLFASVIPLSPFLFPSKTGGGLTFIKGQLSKCPCVEADDEGRLPKLHSQACHVLGATGSDKRT